MTVQDVGKSYNTRHGPVMALDGITFSVAEGEFLCILGPSGCGKTTLLRILAGLEKEFSGWVEVRAAGSQKPINAMVFQENSVFPWMTVFDNVAYGLRMRRVPRELQRTVVQRYLELTGLAAFSRNYPHQLSGGMRQRVSVARAFANDPEILLLDEPFGALDEQNRLLLQQELLRIWELDRKTAVFITHSIDEAIGLGDRILVMTARPGRIKAILPIDLPRPRELVQIKGQPAFVALYQNIWKLLSEEVLRAREKEILPLALAEPGTKDDLYEKTISRG
ncbi:MAG: ABC transporter ATP-binding protein [Firmicutes bacterium]|nr:ABC transporter ATP-binding protein [Bacillota bacterium]